MNEKHGVVGEDKHVATYMSDARQRSVGTLFRYHLRNGHMMKRSDVKKDAYIGWTGVL
jgi:hypothetical protein